MWITLTRILPSDIQPTLLHALLLESMNRFITIVFTFVPQRMVDRADTGLATSALALGPVPGVSLALVRKARILCWMAVRIVVRLRRGWSRNTPILGRPATPLGAPGKETNART